MSLVGPRPPLPSEVANYDVWHRRRLSMKPGMTGLWQVNSRNEREFDRWVDLDDVAPGLAAIDAVVAAEGVGLEESPLVLA